MATVVKQFVTVQEDGRIEVKSPNSDGGIEAESTVLLPEAKSRSPEKALAALDRLQRSLALDSNVLDSNAIETWTQQVRAERQA